MVFVLEIDEQRLEKALIHIQNQIKISDVFKQFNSYHLSIERGDEKVVHCPFHVDDSPSLNINDTLRKWHCFSCGRGGNVVQAYRNLIFFHRGIKLSYANVIDQLLAFTSDKEKIDFTTVKKNSHLKIDETFMVKRVHKVDTSLNINMNDIVRWMKKNNKDSFENIAQVSDFMLEGMSPELILQFLENMSKNTETGQKTNVITASDLLSSVDW